MYRSRLTCLLSHNCLIQLYLLYLKPYSWGCMCFLVYPTLKTETEFAFWCCKIFCVTRIARLTIYSSYHSICCTNMSCKSLHIYKFLILHLSLVLHRENLSCHNFVVLFVPVTSGPWLNRKNLHVNFSLWDIYTLTEIRIYAKILQTVPSPIKHLNRSAMEFVLSAENHRFDPWDDVPDI